ncbi:cytosolic sulfotransferase 12-like protein [Cinnamomum micranthum f. kanehirae]|uniref:Sulfotransferase n=1 Tax=Cinnamomum micranthum f. kanehirae TaxID=337451 RepID=A0A443NYX5_9MAGN|nr:cytosolic sulfotransferase 12-like protein [Cinnamomum micranthum f. kanehirae]
MDLHAIDLYQWEGGFWYTLPRLQATIAMQNHFKAHDDDVILASSMRTGTTWINALIPCIMAPRVPSLEKEQEPLFTNHPNALTPSLEIQIYTESPTPNLSEIPSPRLFRTHLPYQALPESVKKSDCRIIYMRRNPKDTFVSMWHFKNTARSDEEGSFPIEEAFESFCDVHPFGPMFDYVLEYWKVSLEKPGKILFLNYEEMKHDPKRQLKRLAEFLGRPFDKEEDVDKVLWRCSLERLKGLDVNREGVDPWSGMAHSAYFRRGAVGDWQNHLTVEMAARLDEVTCMKLEGSGLNFQKPIN